MALRRRCCAPLLQDAVLLRCTALCSSIKRRGSLRTVLASLGFIAFISWFGGGGGERWTHAPLFFIPQRTNMVDLSPIIFCATACHIYSFCHMGRQRSGGGHGVAHNKRCSSGALLASAVSNIFGLAPPCLCLRIGAAADISSSGRRVNRWQSSANAAHISKSGWRTEETGIWPVWRRRWKCGDRRRQINEEAKKQEEGNSVAGKNVARGMSTVHSICRYYLAGRVQLWTFFSTLTLQPGGWRRAA